MEKWLGSAAICVNNNGEILMVLQGKPDEAKTWSVPSGKKMGTETFEACCVREVKDETGYDVIIQTELFCRQYENYEVHYFLVKHVGGSNNSQDPDDLVYDVKWVSAKEFLTKQLTYPEDQKRLSQYLKQSLLHSEHLYLRECRFEDWKRVHAYSQLPIVSQYQTWGTQTELDSQAYVTQIIEAATQQPRSRYAFAIINNKTSQLIGMAELNIRDQRNKVGEVAYVVHPDFWGRGFASDAANQIISYGFLEHKLHRIFASCDPRNKGSERVMQKLGMKKEGQLRENLKLEDSWRDSLIYSVLEHEFKKV